MNQLKIGAILSYLSIFVTIVIALVYTPFMIRLLGQSEYGLYSLIGSVVGYLSILDMGLGNAIVRYTARNRAIGSKNDESKLNGMFLLLYTLIGLVTVIFGTVLYKNIDFMFGSTLSVTELKKAKIMVIVLIINFALSFPLAVFGSILEGHEKFINVRIVSIIRSIMIPLITLPFLFSGHGSVSMVIITTLVNISCLLINVYFCFSKLKIRFIFGKIDFSLLKEIGGYSFFIFINAIVDKIYWNTGQFILGGILGTIPVAIYAIAMQFINLYMMFSTSISGLFLPRVSMMVANKAGNEVLSNIMIKFGRLQYIIMAFIISGFFLFGKEFITFWAGGNYGESYYITLLLMVPLTIPLIQNIGITILQAKNLHGFRSIVLIIIALINILLSISLVKIWGGLGSAIATAISLVMGNIIIMNIYYHRKIGLNIPAFWKNILSMSFPVLLSIIIGYGINVLFPSGVIIYLFIKIVLFSLIFLCLMWFFGFNFYEKNILISLLSKGLRRKRVTS